MFTPNYPNLELLEYKAKQILFNDAEFIAKLNAAKEQRKYVALYLDAQVFPQVWGSTCLGFDIMPDGSPNIVGCAMTKAYTTVFHEADISDTYIVFFGNTVCYKVENATKEFQEDLHNHRLASLSEAQKRY